MSRSQGRHIRQLELSSRRQLAGLLGGGDRSRFRGQGLEFAELRPYQPGDDPRLIDWNVTARASQPHIRCYQEERSRQVLLLTDLSPSITPAKFALLIETVALLAFAAVAQRDRVGLIGFSDRTELILPPGGSSARVHQMLGRLTSQSRRATATDLQAPLETSLRLLRRPGLILLLSDFHAPLPAALLRRVSIRHDLIALSLRDPREAQLPKVPMLLRDAESGAVQLCEGSAAAPAWQQEDRELATTLRGCGIDLATLAVGQAALPTLRRLFLRRRRQA